MYDKALKNGSVWLNDHYEHINIYIDGDVISYLSSKDFDALEEINLNQAKVFPGLIDPHVHFDLDLGKIRSRDDFLAGSKQAVYGGISTYIDFLDPVDNPQGLEKAFERRKAEVKDSYADYFFHACIKNPQCDLEVFVKKMLSLNIHSLKLFTTYSDSGRRTYDEQIIELLKLSEKYQFLLLAHIENDDLIHLDQSYTYQDLLTSRPSVSETSEALKLAGYVKKYGGYLYMVHLSSGETLKQLKEAYGDIINHRFFIESCPHYFTFSNEDLSKDNGYLYTLAPPLRTKAEQALLKAQFNDVYAIGTDHCAFNQADKIGLPLVKMPLGIGGIEFSFDVMYTLFGEKCLSKMSKHIAKLYPKLSHYGEIKTGYIANLFVYEINDKSIKTHHGHTDYNLYHDFSKKGQLIHHMIRGQWVIKNQELLEPFGKELKK